jgi:hypothetical protein
MTDSLTAFCPDCLYYRPPKAKYPFCTHPSNPEPEPCFYMRASSGLCGTRGTLFISQETPNATDRPDPCASNDCGGSSGV